MQQIVPTINNKAVIKFHFSIFFITYNMLESTRPKKNDHVKIG